MSPFAAVTASPRTYWYLTRASGAVALILLTITVVIGIAGVARLRGRSMPRFVLDALHRRASLLAVLFLVIHILTAVLDGFAPISLSDAVIPFDGAYRPVWLGLGATGFDLLLAVALTSLVRRRIGYGRWKRVHWLAYGAWPVALLHGYGTGSDVDQAWLLAIDWACLAAVLAAVAVRVRVGWPENLRLRVGALGAAIAFAVGLFLWLPIGPFSKNWARRAGTPARLLRHGARS